MKVGPKSSLKPFLHRALQFILCNWATVCVHVVLHSTL